jgi:hypothetical protein
MKYILIGSLGLLTAACTTVSADNLQAPRTCSQYVNLFLQRTEHAAPPADNSQAEHGRFELAEAGQLELADMDKILARETLGICEKESAAAYERAKKALKPWWKRIFS